MAFLGDVGKFFGLGSSEEVLGDVGEFIGGKPGRYLGEATGRATNNLAGSTADQPLEQSAVPTGEENPGAQETTRSGSQTRNIINFPLMWIIEMAQFTITAYYLLGGGYSMLADDHVRMDLFYGKLSKKGKAKMDIFTSFFLIFYLAILFFGSITSLIYTIETKQKLFTAWAPYVWPIKTLMLIGILLMLLQAFSSLFKNIANVRNRKI